MSIRGQTDKEPIARKEHKCHWCGEIIKHREKYHMQSGIIGNTPYTLKLHMECWGAFKDSFKEFEFIIWEYYTFKRGTCKEKLN